jgi:hypothetical protein
MEGLVALGGIIATSHRAHMALLYASIIRDSPSLRDTSACQPGNLPLIGVIGVRPDCFPGITSEPVN